jgi:hypothetical protein
VVISSSVSFIGSSVSCFAMTFRPPLLRRGLSARLELRESGPAFRVREWARHLDDAPAGAGQEHQKRRQGGDKRGCRNAGPPGNRRGGHQVLGGGPDADTRERGAKRTRAYISWGETDTSMRIGIATVTERAQ